MMESTTIDTKKKVNISNDIFDYNYNEGLIHQAVTTYQSNARSGNSAQKTRSEVRGGGKKPWRQKGTGRARAGTIRSPIWRSGGVTFASKKRDYTKKLNKKMYNRAIRSIISELYRLDRLVFVEKFALDSHKTKDFITKMKEYLVSNALIITDQVTEKEYLSCRNLPEFEICDVTAIDPVTLLRFEKVMITESAARSLEEKLQ